MKRQGGCNIGMWWTKARVIVGCCRYILVKFFVECSEVITFFLNIRGGL